MVDKADSLSASAKQWVDSAPDGIVVVDSDGLIRLVNRHIEHIFGYEREELEGKPIEVLIPDRGWPDHLRRRGTYFQNPTSRAMGTGLGIAGRRKDGSEFPVDVSLSLLETDHGLMVSAAVRDVTGQKEIEEKLHGLDAISRLAAIVESSQDSIIGKTLDGVITSWNSSAERMYGYLAEEIIGHNISEIIPDDRAEEMAAIFERVSRGERVHHFETRRVTKDGRLLEMSVASSPIRDASGAVTGASTVARDMTEINRAAAERRTLEARLHRTQRLESLGQLAGGVAHDFNNLLAGIMNYAGLVSATLGEELNRRGLSDDRALATVLDDVEQITKVAKRAAALTRQLLTFSRREVLQPQLLDLNAVVADMEELLRRTIGQNVDQLRTVYAPDLPLISVDRGQIEQVIMNLAVNARDAMPEGGELGIETGVFVADEQYAQLRQLQAGTYVRLSVSDTGTGMSEEVAAVAFEPFFTTKRPGEGTGLGLATVFGIVAQSRGEVAIYSEPGLGTTVRVHLPVTTDAKPAHRAVEVHPPLFAHGETVLLVEDEEIVREPARRLLSRYGYTVLDASNAADALEIERHHEGPIDLLLTDVVMPGGSGKELSVELLARRPETKVLFMSGYSENVIVRQGVLDEGVILIEKPFSADELLSKVRNLLDMDSK